MVLVSNASTLWHRIDIEGQGAVVNLTQLMAFQAVANSGSITKAAQLLHVSQPSISKHVKNLERDCGAKLFERNAGAAELTDAGSSLLRHVNAILVHLDEATRELKTMLLNSTVELALLNELPANPNFASEPFRKEKLVVFAAPSDPLARKKRLTLSDLRQAALVTTGMASAVDKMVNHLVHEGLGAKIAIQCGSPASVKILVKNKIGLGILFEDMLIQEIRNKLFKVLEIPGLALTVQSYIVYYKDRPLSPPAKDFLALLRKRVHRSL